MTTPLKLPRLDLGQPDWGELQIKWQKLCEAVEAHDAEQDAIIADLAAQLAAINAVRKTDAISASFTVPTLIATASDAGANATITMASHIRRYGDGTSSAVTGASLTGKSYSTTYAVYYDDPTRAGGAVTYLATTDLKTAQNNYASGRHYVATLTTPASGGAATTGGTPPPGSGYSGSGGGGTVIP